MGNDVFDSKRIKSCSGGKFRWRSLCLVLFAMMCLSGCKNTNLSAGEWHVTRNQPMPLDSYSNLTLFIKISTGETPRFETANFGKGLKVNYNDVSILESIFKRGEEVDVRVVNMYGYGEFRFDLDTEAFDEACKLIPVG